MSCSSSCRTGCSNLWWGTFLCCGPVLAPPCTSYAVRKFLSGEAQTDSNPGSISRSDLCYLTTTQSFGDAGSVAFVVSGIVTQNPWMLWGGVTGTSCYTTGLGIESYYSCCCGRFSKDSKAEALIAEAVEFPRSDEGT